LHRRLDAAQTPNVGERPGNAATLGSAELARRRAAASRVATGAAERRVRRLEGGHRPRRLLRPGACETPLFIHPITHGDSVIKTTP
jgi:hypothetical protein